MLAGVPLAFGLQFSLGYFLSAALISFSISVAGASLFFFKKDRLGQSKIGWILLTAIAFLISFTACIFAEPLRHTMELHYFSIRP
jgi:hypothetical protein